MTSAGALRASPFQDLERQARRVQYLLFGFVVAIALLPSSVFVIWEVEHHRMHARHDAREIAQVLTSQLAQSGLDLPAISARLRQAMEAEDMSFLRLIPAHGRQTLDLGNPGRSFFPTTVAVPLPSSAAPFAGLEVTADDSHLIREAATMFGVHLLIASVLALVVYRMPMRALRLAIDEAKGTYAQLIHADRLSAIGEMYAGLAHEINNPLGIILSRVRLLLGGASERGLPPELVGDLEMIDRHGRRIAEVIRSLLAFARKGSFEPIETDLNRVVADVVALVERPLAKQDIRIETQLDPYLPRPRASPDHLQQVFLNLVNNARDAMPNGGTITVRTRRERERLVAEVRDSGTGIAPQILDHIFEPFFTTKDVGRGTGLGLSVSYGIVRAHGGEIEVESAPGSGALFRVTLPLRGARG